MKWDENQIRSHFYATRPAEMLVAISLPEVSNGYPLSYSDEMRLNRPPRFLNSHPRVLHINRAFGLMIPLDGDYYMRETGQMGGLQPLIAVLRLFFGSGVPVRPARQEFTFASTQVLGNCH